MLTKKYNYKRYLYWGLLLIICSTMCINGAFAKPAKVLILPFTIHAEKDLSYLQKGISDMLSSRLSVDQKLVLMDGKTIARSAVKGGESINQSQAVKLGKKHGADYVLFGSVTVFFNTISTDAHFINISKNAPAVVFSRSGAKHEDLITHINLFAGQINSRVFGRKDQAIAQADTAAPGTAPETDSRRRHPDKLVKSGPGLKGTGSPFYQPDSYIREDQNLWRKRFKYQIISMAVGDIDADNRKETVLIDRNSIYIYRLEGQSIQKVTQLEYKGRHNQIHVGLADINKNGRAEIFVTSVDNSDSTLMSYVLEYEGKELKRTVKNLKWYLRVLNHPEYGEILLGQKRNPERTFVPGIHLLTWKDGEYQSEDRMPLPRHLNLYGFTFGDKLDLERSATIAYNKGDYLTILDPSGKKIWKRSEDSGGSDIFIKYKDRDLGNNEKGHFYLPLPVEMADVDGDNRFEVITIRNKRKMYSVFDRTRSFKHGSVEILEWNGHGLFPKLLTQKYSEYLSDCAVVDLDNDGEQELAFTAVAETDSMMANAKSFLYVIELQKTLAENKNK